MDLKEYLYKKGIELTEQQRTAVESKGGALLLLAVPGAGKTTALVARVAHLIINLNAAPDSVLTLTFNRDAAKELSQRWQSIFGELGISQPQFSTIHSFCYSILKSYTRKRGSTLPQLVESRPGGMRKIIAEIYYGQFSQWPPEDKLDEIISAYGYAQNMMLDEAELKRLDREIEGFIHIKENYSDYKRKQGLMDFDDMLIYTLKILQRRDDIRSAVSQRYSYINIDEAQDTSLLQHEIIRLIVNENIFMVGDEDQSIYGFRGAYPRAMLEFETLYSGARLLKMERNFRSTPEIVIAANNFISQSKDRYKKEMHTMHPSGGEIKYTSLFTIEKQWDYVADCLYNLPNGTTAAVLFRQGLSAAPIADILSRRSIPFYSRERRSPLVSEPLVRDVLACLTLSVNPGDVQAFLQVYYKLGCYISREIAAAVCSTPSENIFDEIIAMEDENLSTGKISYARAVISNLKNKSPIKMLEAIAYDLGFIEYFEQRAKGSFIAELYLHKFGVMASIAEKTKTCNEFITRLEELDQIINSSINNKDCSITLATIHSSKGLEFDQVYIIDALEGIFPTLTAIENSAAGLDVYMEEEARLFYVAATRAKSYLEIISAERSMGSTLFPSRFIARMKNQQQKADKVPAGIVRGRRLVHFAFGYGEITTVSKGLGSFTVKFAKVGTKVFGFDTVCDTDAIRLI